MRRKKRNWFVLALIAGLVMSATPYATASQDQAIEQALSKVKIFAGLSAVEKNALASTAKLRQLSKGEYLTKKGMTLQKIFIILDGKAKVLVNGKLITTLSGQILIGETEYLDHHPVFADIVITKPSEMIELDTDALTVLMEKNPRIGYVIMRRIAEIEAKRLRNTTTAASLQQVK